MADDKIQNKNTNTAENRDTDTDDMLMVRLDIFQLILNHGRQKIQI